MRRRREAAEGDLSADGGSGLVTGAASVAGGVGGVGAACTGAGATATALRFAAGKSRGDLEQDQMLLFALVHAVKIVGEAAAKITPATRAALPCVPWPLIVGVRNRLVHAYFDTDQDILRATANHALPALLPALEAALVEGPADG